MQRRAGEIINGEVKVSLIESVIFKQRLERDERKSHMDVQKKNFPGRGRS